MKGRSAALLALRFGLTGALLGVAFLLIDFSDRTWFKLKSGETVEAVSWTESGGRITARSSGDRRREFDSSEVEAREDRPGIGGIVRRARPWPALLIVPALALVYFLMAARWRLLLQANGFDVPLGRAWRITWVGGFFNQILPGAVGGDVAKALIVSKGEERKAGLFSTVLLDRLVGLATVVAIAALAILPVIDREALRPVVGLILALLAGGAAGAAVYFSPALRGWPPARRLKERLPFREAVEEVDDVLRTMRHAPRTILGAVALSAAGQATTILGIYALAVSLDVRGVPLGDFFLVEPIIFLVSALPVSVGGWGVEQVAYAQLFGMAGMAPNEAVALSILYKLAALLVALVGGVMFALGATKRATPR